MIRKLFPYVINFLCIAVFLPSITKFAFPPGSNYSDLLISHFPNAVFIKQSLMEWGQIPWWSNTIMSGYPFAANPLSGLWYPPLWIAVLFPSAIAFNFLLYAHLLSGGIGLYRYLIASSLSNFPALLGAVVFTLMPKMLAHYASGHIGLVCAISWIPWLLLSVKKRNSSSFLYYLPGLLIGLIILTDIRISIGVIFLFIAYSLFLHDNEAKSTQTPAFFWHWVRLVAISILLAFLVAAPLILPLMELIPLSTRVSLTQSDNTFLSLPPARLLGLLVPDFWGNAETISYFGSISFALALLTLYTRNNRKFLTFWWLVFFISIILALGNFLPLTRNLFSFPILNLLRVPSRFMFFAGLAISILAAHGVNALMTDQINSSSNPDLLLFALSILLIMLSIGIGFYQRQIPIEFGWGAFFFSGFYLLVLLKKRIKSFLFFPILFSLLFLDLSGYDFSLVQFRDSDELLSKNTIPNDIFADPEEHFRVYSPSYSVPQQIGALYSLELADGVDPLQLKLYSAFMSIAGGVPEKVYSVTIPPFPKGNPATDNQFSIPDSHELGKLNVKYVLSSFPLRSSGLDFISRTGNERLYRNNHYQQRAWIVSDTGKVRTDLIDNIQVSPNRVWVKCNGPGLLVLSEVMYPGWVVKVDGVRAEITPTDGIFRSVKITRGAHLVEFIFKPVWVYIGLGLFVLAVLGYFILSTKVASV